ncbi:MAG: hypothetical protein Q9191_002937 [Dirinaria sp. TL-2023a]
MGDPLSIVTGVLAVAGAAATTCEGLYKILRRSLVAPKDLEHHLSAVQALQSTLTAIAALEGNDAPTTTIITPQFKTCMQSCMLDLQAMERLLKSFQIQIDEGRARRTWAKMRWSSVDYQQKLKSYLNRIESYHRTFSLDLLLFNMLELAMFIKTNRKAPSIRFSIHWNLFWPRTVSWEAEIINLVLCGDVDAVKKGFSTRRSTPFDQLPDGVTILHLAASNGHFELVKFLLREGSRPNAVANFGETPLHSAIALSKNYDVARLLLENGADLQNRNVEGKTPLHTFSSRVSVQVLRCHGFLFDFSTFDRRGMSVLHYMAWSSKTSTDTFRDYHKLSNLDLRTVDAEGRSMLHFAAQRGNVPVIEYIISAAKHFNIDHTDCKGRTAVHYSIENKRACDTLKILVSHGANIWVKDYSGRSVLHHAARFGNLPAVKALLTHGMTNELRATDSSGMTPLMISSYHNAYAVVMFLLEIEGCPNFEKEQIGPGAVECGSMAAPYSDFASGTSTLVPQGVKNRIPMTYRQSQDSDYWEWKNLSPMSRRCRNRLSNHSTCWSAIKFLAIAGTVSVVVVLWFRSLIAF